MGATKQIELSTGKKVTVDVAKLTVMEWRGFFDAMHNDKDSDVVVARCANMKLETLTALLYQDYRLILKTIMDLSNRPLDDPNSVSESTSD